MATASTPPSLFGDIAVVDNGDIGSRRDDVGGSGISTSTGDHATTWVDVGASADIYSHGDGVHTHAYDGSTNIYVAGDIDSSHDDGIDASSHNGNISVDVAVTSDIYAHDDGITADTDRGNVNIDLAGDIGSRSDRVGGEGISTTTDGGYTNIDLSRSASIHSQDDAIHVDADSKYSKAVFVASAGSLSSRYGDGIQVKGNDAKVTVFDTGAIFAGDDGIDVSTDKGPILVATGWDGSIVAHNDGITAHSDDSSVTAIVGADVHAGDTAIDVSGKTTKVVVKRGVDVVGDGTWRNPVVSLDASRSNELDNFGDIHSDAWSTARQSDDVAIDVDGGRWSHSTVNNFGEITGTFQGSSGSDTFNNYSSDTWNVTGISNFGSGYDQVYNPGHIQAAFNGNYGETTQFLGLEKLVDGKYDNGGDISLQDQDSGDAVLKADRLYTSGNFVGDGGTLSVDAYLDSDTPGSGSDADRLIIGGNAYGDLNVDVNNISTTPAVRTCSASR